jgi:hypothetical protein
MVSPTYTYTYDPWSVSNPTGSKVDTIRLMLRINADPWELADQEITYYINTEATTNLKWVAYKVCEAILGNYANQVDRSMGPLSLSLSQKFEHWKSMAAFMKNAATANKSATPMFAASAYEDKIFSIGMMDPRGNQYIDPTTGGL